MVTQKEEEAGGGGRGWAAMTSACTKPTYRVSKHEKREKGHAKEHPGRQFGDDSGLRSNSPK